MDLWLWRHAEAEELQAGQHDLERALTKKGQAQAQRMGAWLNQKLYKDALILVSPAQRCQQTAQALGRPFQTIPTIAPEASAYDLLQAAAWPDAAQSVLLVGHQPTLGSLLAMLMTRDPDAHSWAFKKGAVCWLKYRHRQDQPEVVLKAMLSADMV